MFANLTAANLLGSLLFSSIGYGVFTYGRKNGNMQKLVLGIVLMVYPYLISDTFWMYMIGAGLSALLFF
jgi:hypothetical protein